MSEERATGKVTCILPKIPCIRIPCGKTARNPDPQSVKAALLINGDGAVSVRVSGRPLFHVDDEGMFVAFRELRASDAVAPYLLGKAGFVCISQALLLEGSAGDSLKYRAGGTRTCKKLIL
jgi:hypothetical protein